MNIKRFIRKLVLHPLLAEADIDDPNTCAIVAEIIRRKPFLKSLYRSWYQVLADSLPIDVTGPVLELGSGGGFAGEVVPGLIPSEILQVSGVSIVLDGQCLPFQDQALRGIVMLDVLHHLPRVTRFFEEAARCVKTGGVIAMVEPWLTPWSKRIYRRFHHEPLDETTAEWHFPDGGPLSQANSALPWIIFERDRNRFWEQFPQWRIQEILPHTPFGYLLSGGVSMRSILPDLFLNLLRRIEFRMENRFPNFAMFATIVLSRTEDNS